MKEDKHNNLKKMEDNDIDKVSGGVIYPYIHCDYDICPKCGSHSGFKSYTNQFGGNDTVLMCEKCKSNGTDSMMIHVNRREDMFKGGILSKNHTKKH